MGILADIINKKAQEIADRKIAEKHEQEHDITRYNHLWLNKIVYETGFALTDDEKRIDNILKKLNERDGHCPCGGMTEQFICPCEMMRTHGTCKCGLYKDVIDIEPKDTNTTARIKE